MRRAFALKRFLRLDLFGLERTNVDATFDALGEDQVAVALGEQRVVLAAANVLAGMEFRATLTNDDIASLHILACELLHAKSLCVRIAAVTG